jgi:hypothetical protein
MNPTAAPVKPYSYYIYYRVDPARVAEAARRVQRLIAEVGAATGVRGRVLRKRGEPLLWMEIYENVGDDAAFERALSEAAAATAFQDVLLAGSRRHVECFGAGPCA